MDKVPELEDLFERLTSFVVRYLNTVLWLLFCPRRYFEMQEPADAPGRRFLRPIPFLAVTALLNVQFIDMRCNREKDLSLSQAFDAEKIWTIGLPTLILVCLFAALLSRVFKPRESPPSAVSSPITYALSVPALLMFTAPVTYAFLMAIAWGRGTWEMQSALMLLGLLLVSSAFGAARAVGQATAATNGTMSCWKMCGAFLAMFASESAIVVYFYNYLPMVGVGYQESRTPLYDAVIVNMSKVSKGGVAFDVILHWREKRSALLGPQGIQVEPEDDALRLEVKRTASSDLKDSYVTLEPDSLHVFRCVGSFQTGTKPPSEIDLSGAKIRLSTYFGPDFSPPIRADDESE